MLVSGIAFVVKSAVLAHEVPEQRKLENNNRICSFHSIDLGAEHDHFGAAIGTLVPQAANERRHREVTIVIAFKNVGVRANRPAGLTNGGALGSSIASRGQHDAGHAAGRQLPDLKRPRRFFFLAVPPFRRLRE